MAVTGYGIDAARADRDQHGTPLPTPRVTSRWNCSRRTPPWRAMQRGEPGAPVCSPTRRTIRAQAATAARRPPCRAARAPRSGSVLGLLIDPASALGACHRRGSQGTVCARRDFGRARPPSVRGRVQGGPTRRRPLYMYRPDVPWLPHGARADGRAREGRRARGAGLEEMPGCGSGNVPPRRYRAERAAHTRAQELGAFSRGLRADCARSARRRCARPCQGRPDHVLLVAVAAGVASQAEGSSIQASGDRRRFMPAATSSR